MPEIAFESRAQADAMVGRAARKLMGFTRKHKPQLIPNPSATIYLFNVSDQQFEWTQAGFERFIVPPCEPGREYSKPLVVDGEKGSGYYIEEVKRDDTTELFTYSTNEIAFAICMAGPGMPPTLDLRRKGVFMSKSNPPAKEDLARGKHMMDAECQRLLREADRFFSEKKMAEISDEHIRAARYVKQDREWAKALTKMISCPECGGSVPESASIHAHAMGGCGAILNQERWEKAQQRKSAA